MNDSATPRPVRIAAFLAKYRNAGIFAGMDAPSALSRVAHSDAPSGTPAQFVADLEPWAPRSLDTKQVVEHHLERVIVARLRGSLSPSKLASEALEVQALLREMPAQLSKFLSMMSDNRLSIRVAGLEESRLIENLQKIANRISAGIVTASLVIASAMLMRNGRSVGGIDYSVLVMLLFAIAGMIGAGLVLSALITDRRAGKRRDDTTEGGR